MMSLFMESLGGIAAPTMARGSLAFAMATPGPPAPGCIGPGEAAADDDGGSIAARCSSR